MVGIVETSIEELWAGRGQGHVEQDGHGRRAAGSIRRDEGGVRLANKGDGGDDRIENSGKDGAGHSVANKGKQRRTQRSRTEHIVS